MTRSVASAGSSKQSAGSTPISPLRLKRFPVAPPCCQRSIAPLGIFEGEKRQIAPSISANANTEIRSSPFPQDGSVK